MALGVTDHACTIGELVDAALAAERADPISRSRSSRARRA